MKNLVYSRQGFLSFLMLLLTIALICFLAFKGFNSYFKETTRYLEPAAKSNAPTVSNDYHPPSQNPAIIDHVRSQLQDIQKKRQNQM